MSRTLIYSHVPLWIAHHAEALELSLERAAAGETVYFLSCDGALHSCPANPTHNPGVCYKCVRQTRYSIHKILPNQCINIYLDSLSDLKIRKQLDKCRFDTLEQLSAYKYQDLPVGELVASQLVDELRDVFFPLHALQKRVKSDIEMAISLYNQGTKILQMYSINRVFVWNGRRPSDGPLLYAARDLGLEYYSYISGVKKGTYYFVPALKIHDIDAQKLLVDRSSNNCNKDCRATIKIAANEFYRRQRRGSLQYLGYESFHQSHQKSFEASSDGRPILSIFTSSYWEYFAMPDYLSPIYKNHYDGLKQIVQDLDLSDKWSVYVRWHPNLINCGPYERRFIDEVIASTSEAARHYLPEDLVNSYDIVMASDVVLTFGSTIGIEAAYYGKPSILLGRAIYEDLGSCYVPTTHDELMELLSTSELRPKDKIGSYIFGRYMMHPNTLAFRHLLFNSKNEFTYNSQSISPCQSTSSVLMQKFISFVYLAFGMRVQSPRNIASLF